LPLRARVVLTFAVTIALVTGVLASATLSLATSYMMAQRDRSATHQAVAFARLVNEVPAGDATGRAQLLDGLDADVRSAVLNTQTGQRQQSPSFPNLGPLPASLIATAQQGRVAHSRISRDGVDVIAVVVPLNDPSLYYIGAFSMREVQRNLRFLLITLAASILVSAVAGLLIGRWAANRSLRPLTELTRAAAVAAGGDLSVRLPDTPDRDLSPLVLAFNETAAALEARVTRDARFAGDVSHELRSPLTTMLNAMSVLQRRRAEMPPVAQQAVDLLHADLQRFQAMVNDLLDLAVAREGADRVALEQIDLAVLVVEAVRAKDPALLLCVSSPDHAVPVWADRRRLERALANLIDNAQRHAGGVVAIRVTDNQGYPRVEVDDAGPGIPEEYRERIFDRFTRGSEFGLPRSESGAGLGLALVAESIALHGGWTSVTQRPGGGARFIIELPPSQMDKPLGGS
jgi:two-component system sensor histidine kinase MtrB